MIGDMYSFENYENALDQNKRYTSDDKAMAGFNGLYYKRAQFFWDEHVADVNANSMAGYNYDSASWADGTIYFINTKFLKLMQMKGKDFRPTPFQKPEDQDARVSNYVWYGQLAATNRRKHGVWGYINPSIAS